MKKALSNNGLARVSGFEDRRAFLIRIQDACRVRVIEIKRLAGGHRGHSLLKTCRGAPNIASFGAGPCSDKAIVRYNIQTGIGIREFCAC